MNDTTFTEGNSVVTYCVLPTGHTEATCPAKLHKVFEVCTLKRFNVKWIREEDCIGHQFSKTDILVFNVFEGEVYKQMAKTARSVFGPPCILACLELDQPLPLVNYPCYTAGMKDLDICTSSFDNPKKEDVFKKIALMSGRYSSQMTTNVTHLVTDKVGSLKYKAAVRNGIPVMSSAWVEAVWERSKNEAVHAIHSDFSLYTTPVFGGLIVTCSNMSRLEKEELRTKIEANGGTFSGSLEYNVTDILFLTKPTGDKYKFAVSWQLPILRPDWVYASLEKGYAVPYSDYTVNKEEKSSTPVNKQNNATLIEANASMCSTIAGDNDQSRRLLNETATTNSSIASDSSAKKPNGEYGTIIEKLNLAELRRLGPFLDGLKVYLSGFDSEQAEKLRRIINASGATRFTTLTDTVSHIIVGAYVDADKNEWEKLGRKALVVSVKWLLASSERGKPAPEAEYDVSEWTSQTVVQRRSVGNNKENSDEADPTLLSIVKQYTGHVSEMQTTPVAAPSVTSKVDNNAPGSSSKGSDKALERLSGEMTYTQCDYEPVFEGHKFSLEDLEPEEEEEVQCLVESRQGVIDPVDFTYQVAPIAYSGRIIPEIVTIAWILDCCDANRIVPVQFYHRPLPTVPSTCSSLLKGVVLTVSGFSTGTKRFLESFAAALGSEVQITFSKKNLPQQRLKASTHLCCALPEGKKYEAAMKWKIPAVNPRWLQECLRRQTLVSVADFPVESETEASTLDVSELPSPTTIGAIRAAQPCLSSPALRTLNAPLPFQLTTPETPSFLDVRKRKAFAEFINELDTPKRTSESPPRKQRFSNGTLEAFKEMGKASATLRGNSASELETRVQSSANGPEPAVSQACTKPFQGENIVVYISKKISDETKLQELVISLGGNVSYVHDDSVTHVVLKGKSNLAKEVKLAKDYEQFTVHPDWLYACKEGLARIPEELYPFNLDPKMSLDVSPIVSQRAVLDKPQSTRAKPRRKIVESVPSQIRNDDANDSMEIAEACEVPSVDTQECLQQLELLEQVLSESKNRPNTRTLLRRPSDIPTTFVFEKNEITESQMKHPDSLESQAATVTWADPRESTHQAIMEKQRRMEAGDVPLANSNSREPKPTPVIIFSGLKPEEKNQYTSLVKKLGGRVSESATYDPATTHLVTPVLGRNEKQLGCIAAGKWILRLEWLEDCESCGKFVEEDKYEWGTLVCESNFDRSGISDMSLSLAKASYLWRDARRSGVVGRVTPYQGLAVILHTADKKDAFTRLIEAGGGKIVIAEPPYSDLNGASAILDDGSDPSRVDYGGLARMGIPCIKPNALHDLLNSPVPPPLQKIASSKFAPYVQFFNYAASEKRLGWSWAT